MHAEKAAGSREAELHNKTVILQQMITYWVQIYQPLNVHSTACPPTGTTVLHMATAANMVEVIVPVWSSGDDIERKNQVAVLRNGQIVEVGQPQELVDQPNGEFARLFNLKS